MAKTLISGPIIHPQIYFHDFYLYWFDIVPSYHSIQFKGKLMNQTWENHKKPNFKSKFHLFDPNLTPLKKFFHLFYLY